MPQQLLDDDQYYLFQLQAEALKATLQKEVKAIEIKIENCKTRFTADGSDYTKEYSDLLEKRNKKQIKLTSLSHIIDALKKSDDKKLTNELKSAKSSDATAGFFSRRTSGLINRIDAALELNKARKYTGCDIPENRKMGSKKT